MARDQIRIQDTDDPENQWGRCGKHGHDEDCDCDQDQDFSEDFDFP